MRTNRFALLVLLILSLAACARQPELTPMVHSIGLGGPAARSSAYQVDVCPQQGFTRGSGAECGFLTVPEDRNLPDGKTIRLAVTIFKNGAASGATAAAPLPDPLMVVSSGDLRFSRGAFAAIGDGLQGRTILLMDQRGTGRSEPALACAELSDALSQQDDRPLFDSATIDGLSGVLQTCRQRWSASGITLQAYTTQASAADLIDLRLALGYAKWNLYASGSAAHLAYQLMQDDPQGVRSVIIEDSSPEDAALLTDGAINAQAAITSFFAICAADRACNEAFPDIEARFYRTVETLNAAPRSIEVQNMNSGKRSQVEVNGDRFLRVTLAALTSWDERVLPELPRVIDQLERDQTDSLKTLLTGQPASLPVANSGMGWLTHCTEMQPLIRDQALNRSLSAVNPSLAAYYRSLAQAQAAPCSAFDALMMPTPPLEPIKSGVPTLAFSSPSPDGSLAWTKSATGGLSTVWVAALQSPAGEVSGGVDCMRTILRAFLASPASQPDLSCASQPAKLRWITFQ